ncbi:MAG: glycolate oxidase subunit GlcE [Ancalomicrobiaceae bacterium]|nr:glycolate oxidase subunit GlcE [Ancalomicrobiaceae bacterium]
MDTLCPSSEAEVLDILAAAIGDCVPLAPTGLGTKAGIGRPVKHARLDLSGLAGVILYEPEELVVTVRAGTPVDEVVELLAGKGQQLAFEPPVWRTPDGGASRGTIGGLVAANLSGPRRLKAGAVRDHILGVRGVSGRAEAFKAGGRVVKNVTGYDLARGLAGSWGTLAVLTEVTFKVLPKAETELTLAVAGLAPAHAVEALTGAMHLSADVSSAAHLLAAESGAPFAQEPRTVLRLEGFVASVDARAEVVARHLAPFGPVERLEAAASADVWAGIRDLGSVGEAGEALWRISLPPASAAVFADRVAGLEPRRLAFDWSGGLVWLWVDDRLPDLGAAVIRAAIAVCGGGHATLIRGQDASRSRIDVFEPQPAPLAALSARLKAQFDPAGILNPGRMGGER